MYDRILIPVTTRSFSREIDPSFTNQLKHLIQAHPNACFMLLYIFEPCDCRWIAKSWSRLNVKPGRTPTDADRTTASKCWCPSDWASISGWQSISGYQPIDSKKRLWAGRCTLAAKMVATLLAASVPSRSFNYQWPFNLKRSIIVK